MMTEKVVAATRGRCDRGHGRLSPKGRSPLLNPHQAEQAAFVEALAAIVKALNFSLPAVGGAPA
jgi:hypothetical protein